MKQPWRPAQHIQIKVIGICINKKRLLVMEVYDDAGNIKGVRPLGGVIEFGESRETALKREFQEELGTDVVLHGSWRSFENRYLHGGKRGHEYIFAVGIELQELSLYSRDHIAFCEDSGTSNTARWIALDTLYDEEIELYPDGLLEALKGHENYSKRK